MQAQQFDANVQHRGGATIIDLRGEINATAEEGLNKAYAQAEKLPGDILLDFADVGYINSTGIALIVSLLARARASGRRLLACSLSDHYVEIFNITRLADFMTVFPDVSAALAGSEAGNRNG